MAINLPGWAKPQLLFKAKEPPDLNKYIGRTITIEGKAVTIKKIVGNIAKPQFFEINGEHLIGMLRFFAQINGAKDITEEQFIAFEKMDHEVVDERKPKNEPSQKGTTLDALSNHGSKDSLHGESDSTQGTPSPSDALH